MGLREPSKVVVHGEKVAIVRRTWKRLPGRTLSLSIAATAPSVCCAFVRVTSFLDKKTGRWLGAAVDNLRVAALPRLGDVTGSAARRRAKLLSTFLRGRRIEESIVAPALVLLRCRLAVPRSLLAGAGPSRGRSVLMLGLVGESEGARLGGGGGGGGLPTEAGGGVGLRAGCAPLYRLSWRRGSTRS